MRVPRRNGPRPRPPALAETFDTGVDRIHNQFSAKQFLDVGLITLNRLNLPCEIFPGRDRRWKESVLSNHLAEVEEAMRERRIAGQLRRREAASSSKTKYRRWLASDGVSSLPLDKHPNEMVCRDFIRKTLRDRIHPEWRDRAAFTYGVTHVIGLRPPGHSLTTIDPEEDVVCKDTVLWWPTKPGRRRKLNLLDVEDRRRAAEVQRDAHISRKMPSVGDS